MQDQIFTQNNTRFFIDPNSIYLPASTIFLYKYRKQKLTKPIQVNLELNESFASTPSNKIPFILEDCHNKTKGSFTK